MKYIFLSLILTFPSISLAVTASAQYCYGKIAEVIKRSNHTNSSVLLAGSRRYFALPSNVEESMVLLALASDREIKINWNTDSGVTVTDCEEDWGNYTVLDGFMVLKP